MSRNHGMGARVGAWLPAFFYAMAATVQAQCEM